MNDFIETLNKLIKIINLSLDIDEKQKIEWINLIESFKMSKVFDLTILAKEITAIDLNAYNTIFQKKVNRLSKEKIVKYSTLTLNYIENRNVDNTLAFLENFNNNIYRIKPSYLKRVQKLKEKKGFLYVRQRSLTFTRSNILKNEVVNENFIK